MTNKPSLRTNDQALSTLREKLFLLWGDLEERKTAGQDLHDLKTPRFECCLQEYGIRMSQSGGDADGEESETEKEVRWERRWRMFGTTIV
jgi:protection-of-telomeres protein 1